MNHQRPKKLGLANLFVVLLSISTASFGQPSSVPQPQSPPTLQFDAASVRPSSRGEANSNVPLGPGTVYNPTGGLFQARNFTLLTYIEFAYKMADYQQQAIQTKVPDWVATDKFDIEARTENHDVTKDRLRLMMRSLLAERFKLAVHYETRQVSVYALSMVKPEALGPKLRPHPADSPCPGTLSPEAAFAPQATAGGFPTVCGSILGLPASAQDRYSFGAANVSMAFMATSLSSWGNLGRPVIHQTGLTGLYDFILEYTPDPRPAYATVDSGGPTFQEALRKQLGLKLDAQKGPVDFLILDHIEHPTEN